MARRTIQSPGVEIRESDLSLRTVSQGTTTYITGFANQGPTDEVVGLTTITDFENIYGAPRTPAERYFYHTVRTTLQSTGQVLANRLPYGDETGFGFGSKIGVLAYPAACGDGTSDFNSASAFFVGKPKQFEITKEEYIKLRNGELFTDGWADTGGTADDFTSLQALSSAAIIVVNKGQTVIDGQFNGYYIGLADNTNINPASAYDSILDVQTSTVTPPAGGTQNFTTVPESRLEFALSATPEFGTNPANGSVSQVMEDRIASYSIAENEYDDTLNVGVFKLRQSVFSKDAYSLDFLLEEGYNGSIGYFRQKTAENGGLPVNFFIESQEESSRNIDIMINPFLSDKQSGMKLNGDGTPTKKIRVITESLISAVSSGGVSEEKAGASAAEILTLAGTLGYADSLFPLGTYGGASVADKEVGNIPLKLDRALQRIKSDEKFNIDIIAEGGLGSIHTYLQTAGTLAAQGFDDTRTTPAIEALRTSNDLDATGRQARDAYMSVFNRFNTFCGPAKDGGRGDVLFIADTIRAILISGKDNKVEEDKDKNFYTDIYWAMRHQFELCNTSYATVFANYMKVFDNYSGLFIYVPSSGFAAQKMHSTDAAIGPWGAPAGFNRGIITNAVDVAISPNQRQRDDLYSVNLNPIATFQDRGNVIFGQKTLLKKPSAFDRVNVRRTFLYLEKITKRTMQYFLFENNTVYTRSRIVNTLTPLFENVKVDDGLYDYLVVCDERNNDAEVIDQNELVVDIYLKPVKTAEFILVNFYATRTDASFEEIAGS